MDHRENGSGSGSGELGMPSSVGYSFSRREFPAAEPFFSQQSLPTGGGAASPTTRVGNGPSAGSDRPPDLVAQPSVCATPETRASSNLAQPVAAAAAKYRECLRNHAASVGGLVVDGCGEFMPVDTESDALKCAVCGCHRSFHRKEIEGEGNYTPTQLRSTVPPPYYYHPYHLSAATSNGAGGRRGSSNLTTIMQQPPPPLLALPPPLSRQQPLKPSPIMAFAVRGAGNEGSGGGGGTTTDSSEELEAHTPVTPATSWRHAVTGQLQVLPVVTPSATSRKRFRTKFTADQKDRMLAFAESLGWRMQRRDEGTVDRFCAELGVPRKVFKVWMHNNKNASTSTKSKQHEQNSNPHHRQQLPSPPP